MGNETFKKHVHFGRYASLLSNEEKIGIKVFPVSLVPSLPLQSKALWFKLTKERHQNKYENKNYENVYMLSLGFMVSPSG